MKAHSIPDALREQVEKDWRPVRPLPSHWYRTAPVAAVVVVLAVTALTASGARSDLFLIPVWASWGCSLLQLGFGVLLLGMALRESIPGQRLAAGTTVLLLAGGVAMQSLIGLVTWWQTPAGSTHAGSLGHGIGCLTHDAMLALPTLIIAMWLVFRALPTRAPIAGLMGGAGAGLTADAITHLQCPLSSLRHVLIWHTGALFVLMLVGWLVGTIWERRR